MYQWYQTPVGKKRLAAERKQMRENTAFELLRTESGGLAWCGGLQCRSYYHRLVQLVYSPNHPFEQMKIYILEPKLPTVNHHVYSDGSICYQDGDWCPDWTAFSVYCTSIRFLEEFYSGRMH